MPENASDYPWLTTEHAMFKEIKARLGRIDAQLTRWQCRSRHPSRRDERCLLIDGHSGMCESERAGWYRHLHKQPI